MSSENIDTQNASQSYDETPLQSPQTPHRPRTMTSKLLSGFKQRKLGKKEIDIKGRTQTPRPKILRQYTSSPEALNDLSSLQGDHTPLETDDNIESYISNILKPVFKELNEIRADYVRIKQENTVIVELKDTVKRLSKDNSMLKEKCIKLDNYSRRNHLKICNVREEQNENGFDTIRKVYNLSRDYGFPLNPKDVDRIHRVGQKSRSPRAILVKFLRTEDKENALLRGKEIYFDHGISLEDDYPIEIEERRTELKPILQAAIRIRTPKGAYKYRASLSMDKLNINGRIYTVNTIDKLPHELKPAIISTPSRNGITGFFTQRSPLSNHHKAQQKVRGKIYSSNEQFYMEQKAITFADQATASKIMKEDDPKIIKKLGYYKNIQNFSQNVWDQKCQDIMKEGLFAKFTQNQHLQDFLMNTGTTQLLECNKDDKYWGIGMHLYNPNVWKQNSWVEKAHNHLGNILMDIRRDIRQAGPASRSTPV